MPPLLFTWQTWGFMIFAGQLFFAYDAIRRGLNWWAWIVLLFPLAGLTLYLLMIYLPREHPHLSRGLERLTEPRVILPVAFLFIVLAEVGMALFTRFLRGPLGIGAALLAAGYGTWLFHDKFFGAGTVTDEHLGIAFTDEIDRDLKRMVDMCETAVRNLDHVNRNATFRADELHAKLRDIVIAVAYDAKRATHLRATLRAFDPADARAKSEALKTLADEGGDETLVADYLRKIHELQTDASRHEGLAREERACVERARSTCEFVAQLDGTMVRLFENEKRISFQEIRKEIEFLSAEADRFLRMAGGAG